MRQEFQEVKFLLVKLMNLITYQQYSSNGLSSDKGDL